MCTGIALDRQDVSDHLIEEYDLQQQLTTRAEGDRQEVQFRFQDKKARLPVQNGPQLMVLEWGNRDNKASRLPKTGWCRLESLEEGRWRWLSPQEVTIPASFGLEKGVWFQINEGMKGVSVQDETGHSHVYMLTQESSHYYRTMTHHSRMPVFVGKDV
ncbi:MAG: hypothetical protein ACKVH8_18000 [Pirellulales bacterium]